MRMQSGDRVKALYRAWNDADYEELRQLVAPGYTIHSDPGDGWEGQTLDRTGYIQRVRFSRDAFPDLFFEVEDVVAPAERVAVRWRAAGTQLGDLSGLPASGRRLTFAGQTIYEVKDGLIAGHWQVIDRLGFVQQLR